MGKKTSINTLLTYASSTGEEESGRSGDSWSRNTRSVRETSESEPDDEDDGAAGAKGGGRRNMDVDEPSKGGELKPIFDIKGGGGA